MNNLKKFINGFVYAFNGICHGAKSRNMRVHLLMATLVLITGLLVNLSLFEWMTVAILIALVISAELINSAIEELANLIRDHEKLQYQATRNTRDLAAGAVLVLATASAIVGLLIFLPKIIFLING